MSINPNSKPPAFTLVEKAILGVLIAVATVTLLHAGLVILDVALSN